jgi:hypothetical protein
MLGQTIAEGALRAAQLVPLLFALNAPPPAAAQLPRPAQAEPPFESLADESSPLTLTEHHVEVRIRGSRAQVRSLLTYRNERAQPVSASFAFPFPALLQQGEAWRTLGAESIDPLDSGDEAPEDAEYREVGEPVPPRIDIGYVTVAPGEQIRIETLRATALAPRDRGWRLALPLPVDRSAPYAPQFSADVTVEESPAVTRIASATHGGTATGVGEPRAQLQVPAGRAYLGAQFVVDIDVGSPRGIALWGGEARRR